MRRRWAASLCALALASAGAGLHAQSQSQDRDAPESLLPEGFGDPAPPPSADRSRPQTPQV